MVRGEVWWSSATLPGTRRKRRPLLVVSNDAFNRNVGYPKVMVVHLTTVKRLGGPYGWEVELPKGTAGLNRPSTAKCGEVYTLWKEQLDQQIGTVPAEHMRLIDLALAVALDLPVSRHAP